MKNFFAGEGFSFLVRRHNALRNEAVPIEEKAPRAPRCAKEEKNLFSLAHLGALGAFPDRIGTSWNIR